VFIRLREMKLSFSTSKEVIERIEISATRDEPNARLRRLNRRSSDPTKGVG